MNLTAEQHSVLQMLADNTHGLTADLLTSVYHFDREMVANLVDTELAAAQYRTGKAGGEIIEVVRLRITENGREALKPR
jgi:hypothetical protein